MKSLDRILGCLIGGAVGDALGRAVEFESAESIFREYGEGGITEYPEKLGGGLITDDTQMTLFTANALLVAATDRALGRGGSRYAPYLSKGYADWLLTQGGYGGTVSISWLNNVRAMNVARAPGMTCISAIKSGAYGTPDEPINTSKGCGGVMRVAPIGLMLDDREECARLGAEAAALTHGHDLGFVPAAALSVIVGLLSEDVNIGLLEVVEHSLSLCDEMFAHFPHVRDFRRLMKKAIALSAEERADLEAIQELGEGWVAEESLAIAIYCALKYPEDIERALIAAVNHDGDSDSTGAITGNILGAYRGLSAIPPKYTEGLELMEVLTEIGEDLYCVTCPDFDARDAHWQEKYVYHTYRPSAK